MVKIGMPKGLFYFQHNVLWKTFFESLGCKVITSEDTNKDVFNSGISCCCNETCLPVKVFHGHVLSLIGRADYIFIPRYTSLKKKEYTCPQFCGLPDTILLNLKRNLQILEIKLDLNLSILPTLEGLVKVSEITGIELKKVISALSNAMKAHRAEKISQTSGHIVGNTPSVALLGHPYIVLDRYMSMNLISKLNEKKINVCTSFNLDQGIIRKNARPFENKSFWGNGIESLGSAWTYAEDKNIKGMIYITPFGCGQDSVVTDLIEMGLKAKYMIPFLKLVVDEHTGEAGFDTRLEAFLDIIG